MPSPGILIVDDEALSARNLEQWVRRLQYEPLGVARTADEAIRLAEKLRPDLVLMDVRLRGPRDGIEAAGEIHRRWDIPVIYVTCYADPDTLSRAKQTEPYGYVVKPFDPSALRSSIEMALYKHEMEKRLRRRERYLAALSQMAELLLSCPDELPYKECLRALASASRVQRACLWLVESVHDGATLRLAGEWVESQLSPTSPDETKKLSESQWMQWTQLLHPHSIFCGPVDEISLVLQPIWDGHDAQSALVLPVLVAGQLEGVLVFENANAESSWEPVAIEFLRTAAGDLAQAIVRRRTQGSLQAQQELLSTVFRNVPIGIAMIGLDGQISSANEELGRITKSPDLVGQNLFSLLPPDLAEIARDDFRRLRSGADTRITREIEFSLISRPEDVTWVSLAVTMAHDTKGQLTILLAAADVTLQHNAHEALQDSERRLQTVLDEVPMAVQGYRLDGTIFYWNQASEKTYGYSAEEAIGKDLISLVVPPELQHDIRSLVQDAVQCGRAPEAGEWLLLHRDGHRVPIYSGHVLIQRPGQEPELYCLDLDLTEQKHAEQQLRATERRLQQAERLESLSQLAGGVAHDFNNLLVAIMGNSDLGIRSLPENSPLQPLLEEIKDAAVRAAQLTARMLAFSGRGRFTNRPTRLDELINGAVSEFRQMLPKRVQLRIMHNASDLAPLVEGDPIQLRQAVELLVANAGEAIEGTGTVTISTGHVQIEKADLALLYAAEVLPEGRYAFLEVCDTGCGMDEATHAKLFDPFFTTKFTGRGLGLPAVLGIVRAHRGAIEVKSGVGEGTRVRLILPCHTAEPQASVSPTGGFASETTPVILLADDEDSVRRTAERMLQDCGYEILQAADGQETLDVLDRQAGNVHLVLLDMTMPRLDGRHVLEEMRQHWPHVPVLLCSGYSRQDIEGDFVDLPPDGFLQKPFQMSELRDRIRQILEERHVVVSDEDGDVIDA